MESKLRTKGKLVYEYVLGVNSSLYFIELYLAIYYLHFYMSLSEVQLCSPLDHLEYCLLL